jgi:hypothetical protein
MKSQEEACRDVAAGRQAHSLSPTERPAGFAADGGDAMIIAAAEICLLAGQPASFEKTGNGLLQQVGSSVSLPETSKWRHGPGPDSRLIRPIVLSLLLCNEK